MLENEINQINKRGSVFWSWWITIDRYMLIAIAIVICFSIIMVTTASPAVAERIGLSSFYFIKRQLLFLFIGSFIMLGISFCSFEVIKKASIFGFITFLVLLVIVLFVGEEIKGARRWVSLGFISIQPSDVY